MPKRKSNKRSLAERLFVEEGLSGEAIASSLSVTPQTVSRWRNDTSAGRLSWDEKRKQFLAAPSQLKKILLSELSKVAEGDTPSIDVKALSSIHKVVEGISDKINVQVVYSVFKEFDSWMTDQDPDAAVKFLEWHKLFLMYKAEQES